MKKLLIGVVSIACLFSLQANARELKNISIQDALATEEAKVNLPDDVKFYFGDAKPEGKITKTMAEYTFEREVNASLKSQIGACHSALVSALKELREAAKKEGGNAVVNIKSNAKGKANSSQETFACSSSFIIANVSLSGDVVVIE